MRKLYLFVLLTIGCPLVLLGQTPSPAGFLGYELGDEFTYHYRVLDYVKLLAEKHPDQVKLIEYGKTIEGRPLVVAIMGSPSNIRQLEEIRQSHLRRIGLDTEGAVNAPRVPIAWLSYNVHGDEAVSSETAMEAMYQLLAGDQRKLLDDLIVIVDPCLNPDGHTRYVGWYNQMKGRRANPSPVAREHSQPWPGGRYNHYVFDLNRDWAWQVQHETKLRASLYHQWMPHLHADFHEMGSGASYYFPPAARPYHGDVTPWQREFNTILGDFNRKYFDANQWLYFTRTSYDLFYPSYGDTWPTFNGAIGMTYEQGGGGRAGLALARQDMGDTLTLKTRISHHLAASKATLEALAAHKEKTMEEFESYFRKAKENPIGPYKTYIVKSGGQSERLKPLEELLRKQQIKFGRAGEAFNAQATELSLNKTSKISFDAEDLLISAHQPKSHLLKVLFETNPPLEDSLTYDITSWGLGYVYGLRAYGLEQKREPVMMTPARAVFNTPAPGTYAYLVNWNHTAHLKLLSDLLAHKVRIRTAATDFEIEGQSFAAGALILTRAGNEAIGARFDQLVCDLANKHNVSLKPVKTGLASKGQDLGASQVRILNAPRVGLVSGTGVSATAFGAVWHFLDDELGYPVTVVDRENLNETSLALLDVLILADGNYAGILKEELLGSITEWISKGGKLIAMEGALAALEGKKGFALKRKSDDRRTHDDLLKPFADSRREAVSAESAGGIYEVALDTTHPLAYGYTGRSYYSSVREVYNLEYLQEGWNVGYLGIDAYRSGFVGEKAKPKLRNTLLLGVQPKGRGSVIYMADNPVFRGFWENGKLLFGNAVFR